MKTGKQKSLTGALLEFDMKTFPHYLEINGIHISDVFTPYIPCFKTHSFKYGFRDFRHTKLTLKTNKQRKTDCVTKQTISTYTIEHYFRNLNSESWCSSPSAFHPYKNICIFICVCVCIPCTLEFWGIHSILYTIEKPHIQNKSIPSQSHYIRISRNVKTNKQTNLTLVTHSQRCWARCLH